MPLPTRFGDYAYTGVGGKYTGTNPKAEIYYNQNTINPATQVNGSPGRTYIPAEIDWMFGTTGFGEPLFSPLGGIVAGRENYGGGYPGSNTGTIGASSQSGGYQAPLGGSTTPASNIPFTPMLTGNPTPVDLANQYRNDMYGAFLNQQNATLQQNTTDILDEINKAITSFTNPTQATPTTAPVSNTGVGDLPPGFQKLPMPMEYYGYAAQPQSGVGGDQSPWYGPYDWLQDYTIDPYWAGSTNWLKNILTARPWENFVDTYTNEYGQTYNPVDQFGSQLKSILMEMSKDPTGGNTGPYSGLKRTSDIGNWQGMLDRMLTAYANEDSKDWARGLLDSYNKAYENRKDMMYPGGEWSALGARFLRQGDLFRHETALPKFTGNIADWFTPQEAQPASAWGTEDMSAWPESGNYNPYLGARFLQQGDSLRSKPLTLDAVLGRLRTESTDYRADYQDYLAGMRKTAEMNRDMPGVAPPFGSNPLSYRDWLKRKKAIEAGADPITMYLPEGSKKIS